MLTIKKSVEKAATARLEDMEPLQLFEDTEGNTYMKLVEGSGWDAVALDTGEVYIFNVSTGLEYVLLEGELTVKKLT
jgi:hypothetical protein